MPNAIGRDQERYAKQGELHVLVITGRIISLPWLTGRITEIKAQLVTIEGAPEAILGSAEMIEQ